MTLTCDYSVQCIGRLFAHVKQHNILITINFIISDQITVVIQHGIKLSELI